MSSAKNRRTTLPNALPKPGPTPPNQSSSTTGARQPVRQPVRQHSKELSIQEAFVLMNSRINDLEMKVNDGSFRVGDNMTHTNNTNANLTEINMITSRVQQLELKVDENQSLNNKVIQEQMYAMQPQNIDCHSEIIHDNTNINMNELKDKISLMETKYLELMEYVLKLQNYSLEINQQNVDLQRMLLETKHTDTTITDEQREISGNEQLQFVYDPNDISCTEVDDTNLDVSGVDTEIIECSEVEVVCDISNTDVSNNCFDNVGESEVKLEINSIKELSNIELETPNVELDVEEKTDE